MPKLRVHNFSISLDGYGAGLIQGPDKPFGYALVMMQESGFRHAPVVENGKPIGIVSSRLAFDPELEEFESEAQRRKQFR